MSLRDRKNVVARGFKSSKLAPAWLICAQKLQGGFQHKKMRKRNYFERKATQWSSPDLHLLATSGSGPRGVAGGACVVGGCYGVEGNSILIKNYKALARDAVRRTAGPNYVGVGSGGVAAIGGVRSSIKQRLERFLAIFDLKELFHRHRSRSVHRRSPCIPEVHFRQAGLELVRPQRSAGRSLRSC